MKATAEKINPEDYILSVLSPEDRLEASFTIAKEAFKKTKLTMKDIENSVKSIRRKIYEEKG
jgi:GH35 family endo-1,4-beta-xylanase